MSTTKGNGLTLKELFSALEFKIKEGHDENEVNEATQGWDDTKKEYYRKTEFFDQYTTLTRIFDLFTHRQQSVQSVNNLPSEILCKIFEHLQGDVPGLFPPPTDDEMRWYNLWTQEAAQVCRRWREVALGTPSLWRYIMLGKDVKCPGSLGMTYIQRSHPLNFEINFVYDSFIQTQPARLKLLNDFSDSILANRQRVQALHLTGDHGNPLLKLLNEDLPGVESIHSKLPLGFTPPFPDGHWSDPGAPTNAVPFSTEAPLFGESSRITKLSLSGFDARPPAIFHQLTHLSLLRWGGQYTSAIDFFDFLSACPLLEFFYLQGDAYSDNLPGSPRVSTKYGFRSIPLPCLKRIEFRMPFNRLMPAEFMRYLQIPAQTTIVWPPALTGLNVVLRTPPITQLPPPQFCNMVESIIFQCSSQETFTISGSTLHADMLYHFIDKAEFMIASIPDFFRNIKSIVLADVNLAIPALPVEGTSSLPFGVGLTRLFESYDGLEQLEVRCTAKCARALIKGFIAEYNELPNGRSALPRLLSLTFTLSVSEDTEDEFKEVMTEVGARSSLGNIPFDVIVQREVEPFLSADSARRAIFDSVLRDLY
ncbi:hypothetical protein CPC08DRAFT_762552 [Agrocybe pediades]|nr:hypothetical protein CPC08DRAFT_762552 [Agrocybe pediades]